MTIGPRDAVGASAGIGGSDKWPENPAFCGFSTADQQRKKCPDKASWRCKQSGANRSRLGKFPDVAGKNRDQHRF
jgi:hypothetical protein